MKRNIEVAQMATLGPAPAAGFYEMGGMLYVANGPGMHPIYCGLTSALTQEDGSVTQIGGVSEQTLLKAIAIAQRPELAQTLVGT